MADTRDGALRPAGTRRKNREDSLKHSRVVVFLLTALGLGGCGGDSNNLGASGSTTYSFVEPVLNSQKVYGLTYVDDANTTILETDSVSVTSVNPDGSYTVYQSSPSAGDVVNGTDYSVSTATISLNSSGQEMSVSSVASGGSTTTCTDTPHGAGPDFPLTVGDAWTLDYTFACPGTAAVSYQQMGNVVGVESVTVPAGTFTAIKLESTLTWTDSTGRTHQESVTRWRDVATMTVVKESTTYNYSGPVPAHGYPVSSEEVLESQT